jgi:hypothetical protein
VTLPGIASLPSRKVIRRAGSSTVISELRLAKVRTDRSSHLASRHRHFSVLLAGGAYFFLYGREFVYRFTEAELQEALAARLPIQNTYLFLIQVTLAHPRVALIEGRDRVNAGLDVVLNVRLGDSSPPLAGSVDASGGIRYEASEGKFYLMATVIEKLHMQGIPEKYVARASTALSLALVEYYASHPIYTLDAFDAKQAAARLTLKSVMVEHEQLVVTLGVGP